MWYLLENFMYLCLIVYIICILFAMFAGIYWIFTGKSFTIRRK